MNKILYKTCNSMHHLSSRNNHFWISLTWNAPGCFDMSSLSDMCVAVFKVAATPTVATLPPKLGSSQYFLFASWELSFLFGSDQFCRHTRPRSKAKSSLVSRPTIWSLLLVFGFLARWSGWWLRPHTGIWRLVWPLLWAGIAILDHFLLQNFCFQI